MTDAELIAKLDDVVKRAQAAKATVGVTCGTCGQLIGAVAHMDDVRLVGIAHARVEHPEATSA